VKQVRDNSNYFQFFNSSFIECIVSLWRIYSICEEGPPEVVLTELKDAFFGAKTLLDSFNTGRIDPTSIIRTQKSCVEFAWCAAEYIFSVSGSQQQAQMYHNIFGLIQGIRAIIVSCQVALSGRSLPPALHSQMKDLLVKCATHVKIMSEELRGIPQLPPQERFENSVLIAHGLRVVRDACDKAVCSTHDQQLLIANISRFLDGLTKMIRAYSTNPLDTVLLIEAVNETTLALSQTDSQLEFLLPTLQFSQQDSFRSIIGLVRQTGFQVNILGALHSMSQVPQTLHFSLIGLTIRHLSQVLCVGISIVFDS